MFFKPYLTFIFFIFFNFRDSALEIFFLLKSFLSSYPSILSSDDQTAVESLIIISIYPYSLALFPFQSTTAEYLWSFHLFSYNLITNFLFFFHSIRLDHLRYLSLLILYLKCLSFLYLINFEFDVSRFILWIH